MERAFARATLVAQTVGGERVAIAGLAMLAAAAAVDDDQLRTRR